MQQTTAPLCPVLCGSAASEPITWLFCLPPELPPLLVTRALRSVPLSHQEADRGMMGSDSGSHFSDCSPAEGQHWSLLAFTSSLWQPQESRRGTGKGKGLSKWRDIGSHQGRGDARHLASASELPLETLHISRVQHRVQ